MSRYWFTFGFGQTHPVTGRSLRGCFVVIDGSDWEDARRRMLERFGNQWSFQYDSAEEAGVEHYQLTELTGDEALGLQVAA